VEQCPARFALDEVRAASTLASTDASVTAELAKGKPPTASDAVIFTEGHGSFDVLRREIGAARARCSC